MLKQLQSQTTVHQATFDKLNEQTLLDCLVFFMPRDKAGITAQLARLTWPDPKRNSKYASLDLIGAVAHTAPV